MWTPGVSVGTRIWLMLVESVRARMIIRSATLALVSHILVPFSTHSSPSLRAHRRTPPFRSEPAPGSVWPSDDNRPLPVARRGSHSCFCASVPNLTMGVRPSPLCAEMANAVEPQPQAISSMAMAALMVSTSAPPYASGTLRPSRPTGPIFLTEGQ